MYNTKLKKILYVAAWSNTCLSPKKKEISGRSVSGLKVLKSSLDDPVNTFSLATKRRGKNSSDENLFSKWFLPPFGAERSVRQ